eukprot:1188455-Prorocentrum_minimum.AAC.3
MDLRPGTTGKGSTGKRVGVRSWSERELILLAVQMSNEIKVGNNTYHFCTYEHSFVGTEAVKWMLDAGLVEDVMEAVDLGNQMVSAGLIHHVLNDHYFKNEDLFYR